MKKKSSRTEVDNASLNKTYNTRVRNEYIDYDYIDQLSEEEKQFLAKFTDEYYAASVSEDPIHPIDEIKACHYNPGKKKHKKEYDVVKQQLERANYLRKNDIQGVTKAQGLLTDEMREFIQTTNENIWEDHMIELIYRKRKKEH